MFKNDKGQLQLNIGYTFEAEIIHNTSGCEWKVLSVIKVGTEAIIYEVRNMDTRQVFAGKVITKKEPNGQLKEYRNIEATFLKKF
jgi:hypothetical protein